MRFYYTGAPIANTPQGNPANSLGGLVSSSVVPNGQEGNLFGALSTFALTNGATEVRGIILKNETGEIANNLSIYIEPSTYGIAATTFEIAAVTVVNDEIEKLPSAQSFPYIGTFVEATGEGDKVLLVEELQPDEMIGLWIKRVVEPYQTPEEDNWCSILGSEETPYASVVADPQIVLVYNEVVTPPTGELPNEETCLNLAIEFTELGYEVQFRQHVAGTAISPTIPAEFFGELPQLGEINVNIPESVFLFFDANNLLVETIDLTIDPPVGAGQTLSFNGAETRIEGGLGMANSPLFEQYGTYQITLVFHTNADVGSTCAYFTTGKMRMDLFE